MLVLQPHGHSFFLSLLLISPIFGILDYCLHTPLHLLSTSLISSLPTQYLFTSLSHMSLFLSPNPPGLALTLPPGFVLGLDQLLAQVSVALWGLPWPLGFKISHRQPHFQLSSKPALPVSVAVSPSDLLQPASAASWGGGQTDGTLETYIILLTSVTQSI